MSRSSDFFKAATRASAMADDEARAEGAAIMVPIYSSTQQRFVPRIHTPQADVHYRGKSESTRLWG